MSATELCTACGLCCDGTLFSRVPLGAEERVPPTGVRLQTSPLGARALLQPCHALGLDRCCAIYGERPRACRGFRCFLLEAYEGGEVELTQAQQTVALVHRLRATLAERVQRPEREATGWARTHAAQVPELRALEEALAFHFARPPKRPA